MFPSGIQPRTPFVRNRVIEYDAIGGVIQNQGFSSPRSARDQHDRWQSGRPEFRAIHELTGIPVLISRLASPPPLRLLSAHPPRPELIIRRSLSSTENFLCFWLN
jgi:hypothetical protein